MGELMHGDIILQRTIAAGGSVVPGVHAAVTRLAITRGGEVGIVGSGRILDGERDTIVGRTALAVVAELEVVRSLGET